MHMLGFLGYVVAAFAVAVALTLLFALFRPIKRHDDFLSWRVLAVLSVFTLFAPYGYIEAMTSLKGKDMSEPIKELALDATAGGELLFYKVLKCDDNKARVIVVNREASNWGGFERSVMAINMEKTGDKWEAVEFNWVTSDQRNKDSVTMPPYW